MKRSRKSDISERVVYIKPTEKTGMSFISNTTRVPLLDS